MESDRERQIGAPWRVILANRPRLLRDLFMRVIDRNPRLQVVGVAETLRGLSERVRRLEADWIIVTLPRNGVLPAVVAALVGPSSPAGIVAVSSDGSRLRAYFRGESVRIQSMAQLIEVLCEKSLLLPRG
jgi:hypothetical protein